MTEVQAIKLGGIAWAVEDAALQIGLPACCRRFAGRSTPRVAGRGGRRYAGRKRGSEPPWPGTPERLVRARMLPNRARAICRMPSYKEASSVSWRLPFSRSEPQSVTHRAQQHGHPRLPIQAPVGDEDGTGPDEDSRVDSPSGDDSLRRREQGLCRTICPTVALL